MILQTIQSNLSSGYNLRNFSASSEETLIFRILPPRKLSRSESNLIKIHSIQKPGQPERGHLKYSGRKETGKFWGMGIIIIPILFFAYFIFKSLFKSQTSKSKHLICWRCGLREATNDGLCEHCRLLMKMEDEIRPHHRMIT